MISTIILENLNMIPDDAFSMNNPELEDNDGYSTTMTYPENNFVTEIKFLLREKTDYINNNFQIHFDKYKRISGRIDDTDIKSQFESMRFTNGIRPDLIIHKSQEDTNPENQIFAMECKIDPNIDFDEFKNDLFKLMLYKRVLNYKEVLYLLANTTSDKISNYLVRYKREDMYFNDENLHIIILNKNSDPITII